LDGRPACFGEFLFHWYNSAITLYLKQSKEKRAEKDDDKLARNGSFQDVIKGSMPGNSAPQPKPTKPKKEEIIM